MCWHSQVVIVIIIFVSSICQWAGTCQRTARTFPFVNRFNVPFALLFQLNLSHNRISFITRKTFPSNPYFPYKLREVDLSYNSMPVVTFDLVFGTSRVEKLNLSHNVIADVRKGECANFGTEVGRAKVSEAEFKFGDSISLMFLG